MPYQPPGLDAFRALLARPAAPDAATWARVVELATPLLTVLDRALRACAEGLPRELLACPHCEAPHLDGAQEAEFATRPHHTHTCGSCGKNFDTERWSFGGPRFGPSSSVARADLLAYLDAQRALLHNPGTRPRSAAERRGRVAALDALTRALTSTTEPVPTRHGRLLFVSYVDGHPQDVRTVEGGVAGDSGFGVTYYDFTWSRRAQRRLYHESGGGPLDPEVVAPGDRREFWAAAWLPFVDARGRPVDPEERGLTRLDAPRGDPFEGAADTRVVTCTVCDDALPAEEPWPCPHLFWDARSGEYAGPGDTELDATWATTRAELVRFARRSGCVRTLRRALVRPLRIESSFGMFTLGGRTFEQPDDDWRRGLGEFALEWLRVLRGAGRTGARLRRSLRVALGRAREAQDRRRARDGACYVVRVDRANPRDLTPPLPWAEACAKARAARAHDPAAWTADDVWVAHRPTCAGTLPPDAKSATNES